MFGVHQFLIHPFFVTWAWVKLYNQFPSFKELFCIAIHDIGYFHKPNMDGKEGNDHPRLGAIIALRLFRGRYGYLVAGHSRFYIKGTNIKLSSLYYADKYSHCLIPWWIYLPLAFASGEYYEYINCSKYKNDGYVCANDSPREWYKKLQKKMKHLSEGKALEN